MQQPEENKKCKKCREEKPLSSFNKRKDSIDGRRSECKDCNNKNQVQYRKEYKEKNTGKKYPSESKKYVYEYNPESVKKYRDKNKDKIKIQSAKSRAKARFRKKYMSPKKN